MQTRKALKSLSKGEINFDQVTPGGPLAKNADWLLKLHEKREAETRQAQKRHAFSSAQPILQAARNKADEFLRNNVMPDDTPIVSRFDAFSVVKDASRANANDGTLRKMAIHLERLWHKDPMGVLTAGALGKLRDHYQYSNPRSMVGEVIDTAIPKVSFKNLPVANLVRIASQIDNQQDYDTAIVRNGLQDDSLKSVRARTFIRALVNQREAQAGPVPPTSTAPTTTASDTCAAHGEVNCKACMIKKTHGRDIASRVASRLYKMAGDEPEVKACDDPDKDAAQSEQETGIEGTGMLPRQAAEKLDFEPKINDQQPDQVEVPEDGGEMLKSDEEFTQKRPTMKAAVLANHPFVDDGNNHFAIDTDEITKISMKIASTMEVVPDWWLGSVEELQQVVKQAVNFRNREIEAGKLPPALEKFKKQPGGKKKDKKPKFFASLNKDKIEQTLLEGKEFKTAGYSIVVNGKDDIININSKTGSKKYALVDLDSAIADFMYLASTSKHPAGSPPAPVFFIREGIKMVCPGCGEANSYAMPKTAEDLSCAGCSALIPPRAVAAALEINAAAEEAVLVAVTPTSLQDEFGDKFAKAAEILGTDEIGVAGCRAEAYAINPTDTKLAEVWDFMVQAGFKPIAQDITTPPVSPEAKPGAEMGPSTGPELPSLESPPVDETGVSPASGMKTADEQIIRSAMEHYKNTGMQAVDAIAQFKKDYGEGSKDAEGNSAGYEYDQALVVKIANEVYGGGPEDFAKLDDMLALTPEGEELGGMETPEEEAPVMKASRKTADIPLPGKVNPQQPNAVKPAKLGPDTEQKGEIPSPGKIKTQIKPQGKFSDTGTEEDSDNRDPKNFGAGKPKAQHPITDQKGVKLPSTDMGKDSDTGDNKVTRKMEQVSREAPHMMRSAEFFNKEAVEWGKFTSLIPHAQKLMGMMDATSQKLISQADELATQGTDGGIAKMVEQVQANQPGVDPTAIMIAAAMSTNPGYYQQVYKALQQEDPGQVAPKKKPGVPQVPAQVPTQQPMQSQASASFWTTFTAPTK